MRKRNGFTLIELMIVVAIIAVIAAIAIPGLLAAQRASNERNASTSLKTLASAEADFKANDRNGDLIQNYWTGDVAGLYSIYNYAEAGLATPEPIKLLEISIAAADCNPGIVMPPNYTAVTLYSVIDTKSSYWYFALENDNTSGTAMAYRQNTNGQQGPSGAADATVAYNLWRFGFLAYPEELNGGKQIFIINENNTIFRAQISENPTGTGHPPGPPTNPGAFTITDYPPDAALKSFWSKLD